MSGSARRRPNRPSASPPDGGSRRSRSSRSRRGRRGGPTGDFWGRPLDEKGVPPVERIRPTSDPSALPRSLGDPPLGPTPVAAQHSLAAVYEEAVRAATALAAANGLLDSGEGER